jgi:hypothetical protein
MKYRILIDEQNVGFDAGVLNNASNGNGEALGVVQQAINALGTITRTVTGVEKVLPKPKFKLHDVVVILNSNVTDCRGIAVITGVPAEGQNGNFKYQVHIYRHGLTSEVRPQFSIPEHHIHHLQIED